MSLREGERVRERERAIGLSILTYTYRLKSVLMEYRVDRGISDRYISEHVLVYHHH